MLNIVSCACGPSVYLLWRTVSLGHLPILKLGFSCCWVYYRAVYVFWKLSCCQLHCLQIFSVDCLLVLWFPFAHLTSFAKACVSSSLSLLHLDMLASTEVGKLKWSMNGMLLCNKELYSSQSQTLQLKKNQKTT